MKNQKVKDSGLRVKESGSIYVDRSVFYSRPEVIETVKRMSKSKAYPK